MSWPTAMALFGLGYTIPFAWNYAQQLADELAPTAGHPVVTDSPPIAANLNTIRGVPTP
ncbi:hypothetical protein BN970_04598 [Mycolicibacterium conceptionense]|uniref:Uncharacterized protein n=1 Tax=Mycolicibacterium conceptionense TaxID=451644 RepID=A0A0U1DP06_9MYCO|nr:hypothetical protein [Mycolicibacterium conceptionense]CQD20026.1 hypothetical protein BN970_04598 [Mycolicibacterium conceptionense]